MTNPGTALLTVTALHLGFQATVTTLVYPALARVPAQQWQSAHQAHSRAITPIVAVIYGGLALACGWALLSGPGAWTLTAVAAVAVTVVLTATVAAPAHARLGAGHDQRELVLLLRIDRLRTVAAALALTAAALATR